MSIQTVHKVLLLSNSPNLEVLLHDVGIRLPKIPCCQWRGLRGPFCLGFAFMVFMTPMEKSHALLAILQSHLQNLCAMYSATPTMHMWHLSSLPIINFALQALTTVTYAKLNYEHPFPRVRDIEEWVILWRLILRSLGCSCFWINKAKTTDLQFGTIFSPCNPNLDMSKLTSPKIVSKQSFDIFLLLSMPLPK